MTDYFSPVDGEINTKAMSSLGLAHMGDAIYELMVRSFLCSCGELTAKALHRETVLRVSAPAQAKAAKKIENELTTEERDVYNRGRNAKVNSVPSRARLSEYHAATGLETLFGELYLTGKISRLNELFAIITED